MKLLFIILIETLFFSNTTFGMGGDKPGPNGGYISMPGTYHVELVPMETKIIIYLLDLSLKNPIIDDSKVSLKFIGDEINEINCKAEKNYFICTKPDKNLDKYKQIDVESIRKKVKGKVAIYQLPLKFDHGK